MFGPKQYQHFHLRAVDEDGRTEDIEIGGVDARIRRQAALQAQALSLKMTEVVYAGSVTAARLVRLLAIFFGDSNAVYAFKKALIRDIEGRIEWLFVAALLAKEHGVKVQLVSGSPLDQVVYSALVRNGVTLGGVQLVPIVKSSNISVTVFAWLRRFVNGIGAALRFFPIRQAVWSASRRKPHYRIAKANKWGIGERSEIRGDLFIVDGRRVMLNDLVIILNKEYFPYVGPPEKYRATGVPCTDPGRWCIPAPALFFKILPRLLQLHIGLLFIPELSPLDTYLKDVAAALTQWSLPWVAFMQNYQIDYLMDDEEYNPLHVVKTMVLNQYGAKTLRSPHSLADCPGSHLAYVHYDVFASNSDYLVSEYGQSWSPRTLCVPVGQIFNDALLDPSLLKGTEKASSLLEGLRADGKRILVVLTDSTFVWAEDSRDMPRQHDSLRIIRIALAIAYARDDLVIVVKPKGHVFRFLAEPPYSEVLGPAQAVGKAYVMTPEAGYGATDDCAVLLQFVLPYATACLSTVGSAVYETLAAGVPIFALASALSHQTGLRRLLQDAVIFEDERKLQSALEQVLDTGEWEPAHLQTLLDTTDPYRDGRALERLRAILTEGA